MATEVVIKSTPFNSVESGGKYDRPVFAQDFADFFNVVAGHGIVVSEGSFDSPEMKPTIGGDSRSVSVATGYAVLGGRLAEIEQTTQIDAEIGGVKDRYDRLVLEMSDDLENRNTKLKLLKGVEGAGKPPDIVQEKNFFQLSLCKWKQSAGSALISEFVDEREDESVCGFFYPLSIVIDRMLNSYSLDPKNIIPERADLNDYTEPGSYRCKTDREAASLTNSPVEFAFNLDVMSMGVTVIKQIVWASSVYKPMFQRVKIGAKWNSWVQMGTIAITKVWQNASSGSDFPAQTIKLNVTDASFILVVFKITKSSTLWKVAILTCDGNSYIMDAPYNTDYSSSGAVIGTAFRGAVWKSNGIEFGKGYSKDHLDKNAIERPSFIIPTKIFVVKGAI